MITVVFWDIDNTLVATEELHDRKFRNAAAYILGRTVPDNEWQDTTGISEPDMFVRLSRQYPDIKDWPAFETLCRDFFMSHTHEIAARPGVQDALRLLSNAGVPMAAVTSCRAHAALASLKALGIEPGPRKDFKFVLTLDD